MERKHKLAAALAALMMAAGIEAATAVENLDNHLLFAQQRIEVTSSLTTLQAELEVLRVTNPNSPLIALLMSRIVELSPPSERREYRLAFDVNSPY